MPALRTLLKEEHRIQFGLSYMGLTPYDPRKGQLSATKPGVNRARSLTCMVLLQLVLSAVQVAHTVELCEDLEDMCLFQSRSDTNSSS